MIILYEKERKLHLKGAVVERPTARKE